MAGGLRMKTLERIVQWEVPIVLTDLIVQDEQTSAVGADYAGVDLIANPDKQDRWLVLEVNSMPAWQGLQSVSKVDIADALATDLLRRVDAATPEGPR